MIKILIVEDDLEMLQTYSDVITSFNEKNELKIEYKISRDLDSAYKEISENNFDAAIVDLILRPASQEADGIKVIEKIMGRLRFPIFVYSGNVAQLDEKFNENIFFRKHSRDSIAIVDILKEIQNIYKTGITKILGRVGLIESFLNKIFWDHLSSTLDYWMQQNDEKTLLRYTLSHIQEYLDLDANDDFENYNLAEVYIKPAIKSFVFTGSILKAKTSDDFLIVLTPACDLANKKAERVVLANIGKTDLPIINSCREIIKSNIIEKATEDQKRKHISRVKEAKATLEKFVSNNYSPRYYYLPQSKLFQGGIVDYQKIQSISISELIMNYDIILSVTNSFSKDIIARFSYYYSRQGQPDLERSILLEQIIG